MIRMSRLRWKELENAFLAGDLDEEAFCKSKDLDLTWFREELSKSDSQESASPPKGDEPSLFVELLPSDATPASPQTTTLKLKFREVEFEYGVEVGEETLRQVLRVIREEL